MSTPEHDQAAAIVRQNLGIPKPDLQAAFTIETTIDLVDHEGLGIVVSELTDHQQADFLTGLAEGFSRFGDGNERDLQLAYIARLFKESPDVGIRVATLLHDLAEFINMAMIDGATS